VVAGIVLAIWITDRRYRKAGGPRGVILDVAAWAVPAGLILAAIGVLLGQPRGGWQAVRTWDAVLGFPGAVALGTLAAWLACRHLRPARPERPQRSGRPQRPERPASGAAAAEHAESPAPATVAAKAEAASPSPEAAAPSPLPSSAALTLDPAVRPARAAVLAAGGRRLRFGPVAAAAAPAIAFGTAIAAIGSWFSQQGFGRRPCRGRSRSRPRTARQAMRTSPHSSRSSCTRRCGPSRPVSSSRSRRASWRCAATGRSRCTRRPTRQAVSLCFGWVSDTYLLCLACGQVSSATLPSSSARPFTWFAPGPRAPRLSIQRTSRRWKAIHQSCNVNVTYV